MSTVILHNDKDYKLFLHGHENEVQINIEKRYDQIYITPEELEEIYQLCQQFQKGRVK